MDVNIEELDRILDGAREALLSEADCEKVKNSAARPGGDAGPAAKYGKNERRATQIGRFRRHSAG